MKEFLPENFTILVVDDISQNLQTVGAILDTTGYDMIFALSGQQALDCLKTIQVDLILLDLMMPEMSGIELCQYLKSNPAYQEIPVIFLTASNDPQRTLAAFEAGAVDYVTKPFNTLELLARVKTHLELKHAKDDLARTLEEVRHLAMTDMLTEVANRRHWLGIANQELERSRRYQTIFSIIVLDLDRFKKINDTFGHPVGDHVLQQVAQTLVHAVRDCDLVGRIGGEEFAILLPETTLMDAVGTAERLRQQICELQIEVPALSQVVQPTASMGVASYRATDLGLEAVMSRGDRGLYAAKTHGRNVVFYELLDGSMVEHRPAVTITQPMSRSSVLLIPDVTPHESLPPPESGD